MTINEVFPNPTVKQVIFQIQYPNLFYLESRIGDFQIQIMQEFPDAQVIERRQFVIADVGQEGKLEDAQTPGATARKTWRFKSRKNYYLSLLTDSLSITSELHKTYRNPGSENRFRDIIAFVTKRFFEVTKLPVITRLGLRYIDECPLPEQLTNERFNDYYATAFPLKRFNLPDAQEMDFKCVMKCGDYHLRYIESLQIQRSDPKLILDFDGWSTDVEPERCMEVADAIHGIISDEFERTIKSPVYDYMRTSKEQ